MIKLIMISSFAVLVSCASWKERKASEDTVKAPVESVEVNENEAEARPMRQEDISNVTGTVRLDRPGCPVTIDMTDGDLFFTVYPVNLEEQFCKEGLKLKFSYTPSRGQSPESCTADMVVAVSRVEIIK